MSESQKEPNRYVKFAVVSNHFETCKGEDCTICSDYSKLYLGIYKLYYQVLAKEETK